jgi:hypothetical protein
MIRLIALLLGLIVFSHTAKSLSDSKCHKDQRFDSVIITGVSVWVYYDNPKIKQIDHVYLTVEELHRIKELSINDVLLDSVRDVFLIGCYTGLRISDTMSLLKRANQSIFTDDGVKYFHIKQIKTSNTFNRWNKIAFTQSIKMLL